MSDLRKNIKRVFSIFALLFVLLLGYFLKFIFIDSQAVVTNASNPRISVLDEKIVRGEIKDANGLTLAYSESQGDATVRQYVYGPMYAHVVGYADRGKYGAESKYNFELQKMHFPLLQRLKNVVSGDDLAGNAIVLTLDHTVQKKAYELLGSQKGGIVVMEPATGKILAMVSYPAFDPNTINQQFSVLREDESSPLFNRAAQGGYPPGSVFKMITTAAGALFSDVEADFIYHCQGSAVYENKRIRCFNETAHGEVDLKRAIALSCNCYFAELIYRMGEEPLIAAADRFYFDKSLQYPLEYNTGSFALAPGATVSEQIETAIGQGKTLTNPLHMAMAYSAIANRGFIMKPYLLDHIEYPGGAPGKRYLPEKLGDALPQSAAEEINGYLVEAVRSGTASPASLQGIQAAAKTGTAETASGDSHAWFVCYAPAEDPQVLVAAVLENAGNGSQAVPIGRQLMETALAR